MLQSIRLRNLRSFANDDDAPYIDLKPLTVLIGKNSSGKSSFLRSLPLLRQSVEANTTGPILWYSSYVDFGAFSEALNNESGEKEIYFDFKIEANPNSRVRYNLYSQRFRPKITDVEKLCINIEVGVTEVSNKTVLKELSIEYYSQKYKFIFHDNHKCELYINGSIDQISDELVYLTHNEFLPVIGTSSTKSDYRNFNEYGIDAFFNEILHSKLKKYFGNTSDATIKEGLSRIGIHNRKSTKIILKQIFKLNKTFTKQLAKNENEICNIVYNFSLSSNLNNILDKINNEIEDTFKGVKYIAPLRSTAERFYRHQDLQVKEIDHTGSNLAMLLKSFSKKQNDDFTKWTSNNFGFIVRVEEKGLHYALKIKTENDTKEYNINDMGFGFSQILPIVASIWIETSKHTSRGKIGRSRSSIIFAIEQPELHLHPEYQARLSKMFVSVVNVAKENNVSLRIIFETHSQTMIDTLGDCIENNKLNADDVNIVLFEKERDKNNTIIQFSNFNSEGFLESWPIGFFSGRK